MSGVNKIKGILFMFGNAILIATNYTWQKYLQQRSKANGNPINAFESMYWVSLILLPIFYMALKYFRAEFFPIPEKIRFTFIMRCMFGMLSNVAYIASLEYISFSEATVIFWTCPVFTTICARYMLQEKLSNFDWAAVVFAFLGILMI